MKDRKFNLNQWDAYKKVRKPLPPPEKTIVPKEKYERNKDWKKDWEREMEEEGDGNV